MRCLVLEVYFLLLCLASPGFLNETTVCDAYYYGSLVSMFSCGADFVKVFSCRLLLFKYCKTCSLLVSEYNSGVFCFVRELWFL